MLVNVKKEPTGFTLVEVVISLLVLSFAAAGLVSFLISIQYRAENNLYESTALTVSLSALEQMKSMTTEDLENSMNAATFNLNTGTNGIETLSLGQAKELPILIVTNGEDPKSLPLVLTPSIETIAGSTGFWLRVQYEYDHPRSGRTRTEVMGCVRSRVQSF
jgi:prepilin-type N-terminal cleavage/methylation domain-containing protein